MTTKAELEAEVAQLRAQNGALRAHIEKTVVSSGSSDAPDGHHFLNALSQCLKEHGHDVTDIADLGSQMVDEVSKLHREHPAITLITAFALGCIFDHTFRQYMK